MVEAVNQETKDILKQIVNKIENLEKDKLTVMEDIKNIYAEAASTGFDVKTLKQIIRIRKIDKSKLQEQEELLDLYMHALGMAD